ncbi:MAG TPA: hypothetical protein VFN56_03570 [Candidatus Saccharimonadales bacterium]|nr:hypothetical protein [Candidatus Saccharimonadales bacterium]
MSEAIYSGAYRPLDLERLVVLVNPVTTNANMWQQHVDDFAEIPKFRKPHIITTEQKTEDTVDKMAHDVREGDLIYVWSGDGGTNDAIQFVGSREAPNVGVMASEAGDARNFRKATIDDVWDGRPSEVLKHGRFTSVCPLRTRVEGRDNYTQLALTVVGIGAMATGAEILDEPKHRNHPLRQNLHTRLLYQKYLALKALPKIHDLHVEDSSGEPMTVAEVMAVNAPLIAKEFKFDTQIDDPDFLVGIIRSANIIRLTRAIMSMRKAELPVCRISDETESVSFHLIDSEQNQHARIHLDGKARVLAPGSHVTIDQVTGMDRSHQPISTITSRLAA